IFVRRTERLIPLARIAIDVCACRAPGETEWWLLGKRYSIHQLFRWNSRLEPMIMEFPEQLPLNPDGFAIRDLHALRIAADGTCRELVRSAAHALSQLCRLTEFMSLEPTG
ncbi:MAG TPA: hypothetical protein VIG47_14130, partial [Gemmatimonadaceae bacterium]